jgi:hypothetical protein
MDDSTIRLRFDGARHEDIEVTRLRDHQFKLTETPLLATVAVHAGDVIEAEPLADGTHRFVRVVDRSPMRHFSWVVPRGWFDSPARDAYLERVEAAGGTWEQISGGVLYVHIPSDSAFDAEAEFDRYLKTEWPEA